MCPRLRRSEGSEVARAQSCGRHPRPPAAIAAALLPLAPRVCEIRCRRWRQRPSAALLPLVHEHGYVGAHLGPAPEAALAPRVPAGGQDAVLKGGGSWRRGRMHSHACAWSMGMGKGAHLPSPGPSRTRARDPPPARAPPGPAGQTRTRAQVGGRRAPHRDARQAAAKHERGSEVGHPQGVLNLGDHLEGARQQPRR